MAQESLFWEGNSSAGVGVGDVGPYGAGILDALVAMTVGRNGVLSGLAVVESSPAGKSVTVKAGTAIVGGKLYRLDADITLTIDDNTSGNPRIDTVVLETDWTAQTIRAKVIEGTAGSSPSAPTLTQNSGVLWQEELADVAVTDSFTSIVESDITRTRNWARDDVYPGAFRPSIVKTENIPAGWAQCYGQALSRTTYRDLFDMLGETHGAGDGSTTFNLPDYRGRVHAGRDNMGGDSANNVTDSSADSVGSTMGEETHTLTEEELASHDHASIKMDNGGDKPGTSIYATGSSASGISISNSSLSAKIAMTYEAGGDTAHNNMQPTAFGNWIVFVGTEYA